MLRLVFDTTVFGPLHFEYPRPRIRVGSCRDNDLVLLHPSVQPYHCTLALEEDGLVVLPANTDAEPDPTEPRLGPGDALQVGALTLRIERSPNSIAVPPPKREEPPVGRNHHGHWKADLPSVPDSARWLCDPCKLRFEDRQVRAIGLEGGRKHILCPQCSRELVLVKAGPRRRPGLLGVFDQSWHKLRRALGFRPPPHRK